MPNVWISSSFTCSHVVECSNQLSAHVLARSLNCRMAFTRASCGGTINFVIVSSTLAHQSLMSCDLSSGLNGGAAGGLHRPPIALLSQRSLQQSS
ncbi:unnamed protein product [Pieris macdunnoughi]|uniref:Uncharacterized protein n=1 Tax=Pieris macdunnoughi TaxID=345717 RepID=A0A821KZG3_9NEOP|nr:unnamed protein product [Pieris macdunnoughi]